MTLKYPDGTVVECVRFSRKSVRSTGIKNEDTLSEAASFVFLLRINSER